MQNTHKLRCDSLFRICHMEQTDGGTDRQRIPSFCLAFETKSGFVY